jgi:N-acetylmuramoyl-L-alanine amidase
MQYPIHPSQRTQKAPTKRTQRQRLLQGIVQRPSPNFNDRGGASVLFLVQHYTAMDTTENAILRLCDPTTEVSAHYVVGDDGTIYQLVAEDKRAWHAGISFWDGHNSLNSPSIGIEIANPGDVPFPKVQMDAVAALSQDIIKRHKIRSLYVVAHSDIAPDRKQDPGELFDWQGLASVGVGVWPVPVQRDIDTSSKWTDADVMQSLNKFGFVTGQDLKTLVTAFQRHFQPEVFKNPQQVGVADDQTKARLACLLRRKAISDGLLARKTRLAGSAA